MIWFDFIALWFGRFWIGVFTLCISVALLAHIVDWVFGQVNDIKIFIEFIKWRKENKR